MLLLFRPAGANFAEIRCLSGNVNPPREPIQRALPLALNPNVQVVVTAGHAV
jgi:hypothetical protein